MGQVKKLRGPLRYPTMNNTLTSGITKSSASSPIANLLEVYTADGVNYTYKIQVNTLIKNIAADAAEAFGEHIFSYPSGLIKPNWGQVKLTSLCPTGLSATAGEVGLGSVIASGAVATLGGTSTFEDQMEGTTLANHVAATTLTSRKANRAAEAGTTATNGVIVLDGSATAAKCHLNIASTWNQTAAENFSFSALIVVNFDYVGTGTE